MSGVRISDQHFALGDTHELAIHVPRATRRHVGINQFSSVELAEEMLRRPNGAASVLSLVAKVAERLAEIEELSKSLKEQVEGIEAKGNAYTLNLITEISELNTTLSSVKVELTGKLAEVQESVSKSLSESTSTFKAEIEGNSEKLRAEIAAARAEQSSSTSTFIEHLEGMRAEFSRELGLLREQSAKALGQLTERLNEAKLRAEKAERDTEEILAHPHRSFTTRELASAIWKRLTNK